MLVAPLATAAQNRCRCSRRPTGGRPGERITGRPVRSDTQPFGLPIATLLDQALRRPLESALDTRAEVMDGQALGLEDESFDMGTSTFGLVFFPDPLVGLRELRRVLRPAGRVGIAAWDMTQIGLPQLLGAALARALPDLPAPAPPPWAHLREAAGLGQALRVAGFTDVAVHQVTHHWRLPDPASFFRQLPDWTPPLRPLFTSLPAEAIDRAAAAFGDVVSEQSTTEGMPQSAVIGIAAR